MSCSMWTCCFAALWLLVAAGTAMLHIVIDRAVPPLEDLPANIALGFGEVFKFNYLQRNSAMVRRSAVEALGKCSVNASAQCPGYSPVPVPGMSDTGDEREAIASAFNGSLAIIERVAYDRYFGTPELQRAAKELSNISTSLEQLEDEMECRKSNMLYCNIYEAGGKLLERVAEIKAELHSFQDSKPVQFYEEHSHTFKYFQVIPYILVLAMLFYTCFWCKGGSCCPEGAPGRGCCPLLLFAVLWTLFLAVVIALLAGAVGVKLGQSRVRIPALNGDPSLQQVIEHIQDTYPEFWGVAFADLTGALAGLVGAAALLLIICILVLTYACCVCACARKGNPID